MIRSSHDNFYVLKYLKIEQQNFEKRFHLTSIANEPHFSFKYQSHFDTGKNDIIMKITNTMQETNKAVNALNQNTFLKRLLVPNVSE